MSYTCRGRKEAAYRGKRLVDHSFHRHMSNALKLVVDDELWDQLGLCTVLVLLSSAVQPRGARTKPNM